MLMEVLVGWVEGGWRGGAWAFGGYAPATMDMPLPWHIPVSPPMTYILFCHSAPVDIYTRQPRTLHTTPGGDELMWLKCAHKSFT